MQTSATAMDRLGRRDDHGGMTSLTGAVLIAATLATGWVAGVLGHYAHTLMPALRRVDDRTFVTAFQAIDRAILNPWFMVAFFGAPVLAPSRHGAGLGRRRRAAGVAAGRGRAADRRAWS